MKRLWWILGAFWLFGPWGAQAQIAPERTPQLPWQQAVQQHLASQPQWQASPFKITWPRRLPAVPACTAPLQIQTTKRPVPAGWVALSLRCEPARWSRQIELRLQVLQKHLVAASNLMPGHLLTERDLRWAETDSALVGEGVALELSQAVGLELRRPMTEGSPVRLNSLQAATVITKGTEVTLIFRGAGFELETRGQALDNAPMGGIVRINIKDGTILPARVIANGLVLAQ